MIKIAVIGAGKWGKNHARVYSELAKNGVCEFVGIADLNPNAEKLAKEYGVKFVKDYKEILPEVDAVSIAVPTDFHYDVVKECLNAGKHVLVEKPITLQAERAKELIELAKSKNLVLTVGYIFRFNPAVLELKKMLKEIGDLHYITARYVHGDKPPRKDCGVVFNFAVHLVDILNFVLDKSPKKVYCKKKNYLSEEREDIAFITLDYGDFVANLEVSWFHPEKKRDMWVIASKEKVYIDLLAQAIERHPLTVSHNGNKRGDPEKRPLEFQEPLKAELENFCKLVEENHNTDLHIPLTRKASVGEEEYLTTKLCELCFESAKLGKEISLENEND
jgi:UDP-N-acetylglucosamine 3-dehydrogenase